MEQILNTMIADPDRTNAMAAVANVVIAFIALFIAVISIAVSLWSLRAQKRHNELSVKPLPFIAVADYENRLWVKVVNSGSGPLIVTATEVSGPNGTTKGVIDQMPPLPQGLTWRTFTSGMENRSFLPSSELFFIDLELDPAQASHKIFRDQCRRLLSDLTVTVHYTDVYGRKYEPAVRKLDWFRRISTKTINAKTKKTVLK